MAYRSSALAGHPRVGRASVGVDTSTELKLVSEIATERQLVCRCFSGVTNRKIIMLSADIKYLRDIVK